MNRSTARALAIAAIAAQVVFVAAWVVAGALEPGYSHARAAVSELGAATAGHPWIVNSAMVVLGLSVSAIGMALRPALPRRRAATVAIALFVVAGLCMAAAGPLNLDCQFSQARCEDAWRAGALSSQTDAHLWLSSAAQVLMIATPFALARALRPSPVAAASMAAGIAGLVIAAVSFPLYDGRGGIPDGLVQRFDLLALHVWVVIIAIGVLWSLRRSPRPGALVPLRPRDFLAREWSGEGELVMRPLWLGRRFPQRFAAHRRTTSVTETLWRIEDAATFGEGRVQRRVTYCEFEGDDHLALTAADLPDGAEMWLEEGGYRTAPFRMGFPLGPLPVLVRVHDRSYVDPDGTFVNRFDAYSVGLPLPLARTTFRVRPL